jgi:hypothetical protein
VERSAQEGGPFCGGGASRVDAGDRAQHLAQSGVDDARFAREAAYSQWFGLYRRDHP